MRIGGAILLCIGVLVASVAWYVHRSYSGTAARVAAIATVSPGWLSDSPTVGRLVLVEGKAVANPSGASPISRTSAAYWRVENVQHYVERERVCESDGDQNRCRWEDVKKTRDLKGQYQNMPLVVRVGDRVDLSVDVPQDPDATSGLESGESRKSGQQGGYFGSDGDEYIESTEYLLRGGSKAVLIGKVVASSDAITLSRVKGLPLVVRGTRASLERSLATGASRASWAMYGGLVVAAAGALLIAASFRSRFSPTPADLDSE